MKVSTSIKKICKFCKVIKRNKVIRIICNLNSKHNQRQG